MTEIKIKNTYANSKQYTNAIHFGRIADLTADEEKAFVDLLGRVQSMESTLTKKGIRKDYSKWLADVKSDLDTLAKEISETHDIELIGKFESQLNDYWYNVVGISYNKGGRVADPEKVYARLMHDMKLLGVPEDKAKEFLGQYYNG